MQHCQLIRNRITSGSGQFLFSFEFCFSPIPDRNLSLYSTLFQHDSSDQVTQVINFIHSLTQTFSYFSREILRNKSKQPQASCSFPRQTTNLVIIVVLFRDQCGRKTLELVRSFSLPLFQWNRRVLLFNSYENALPTSTTRNPDFSLW